MEFACSLKESSPDDPPRANIAFFLAPGPFEVFAATMSAVGMDEGADRSGMDLYDELTCDGEKPLTTLVELLSEVPLTESEEAGCAETSEAESEVNDSTMDGVGNGFDDSGADWGSRLFAGSGARYEWVLMATSGSRFFFSLMVMTIFSRSSGVMCLSRPRLRLCTESCLRM